MWHIQSRPVICQPVWCVMLGVFQSAIRMHITIIRDNRAGEAVSPILISVNSNEIKILQHSYVIFLLLCNCKRSVSICSSHLDWLFRLDFITQSKSWSTRYVLSLFTLPPIFIWLIVFQERGNDTKCWAWQSYNHDGPNWEKALKLWGSSSIICSFTELLL